MARMIRLHLGPCQQWQPAEPPGMVVCNPPWGHRLLGSGLQPGEAAGFRSAISMAISCLILCATARYLYCGWLAV